MDFELQRRKGFAKSAHTYKSLVAENSQAGDDDDRAINMGLFSYPVLMAADILIFNATHVPVGRTGSTYGDGSRYCRKV